MLKPVVKIPVPAHPTADQGFVIRAVSYGLAAALCLAALLFGLLPGLLAVCLGFLLAQTLVGLNRPARWRATPTVAAGIVVMLPILAVVLLSVNAKGMAFGAIAQYQALLHLIAETVLQIRLKLPPDIAMHLPDELIAAQAWLAEYLKSQAHALSGLGTAGLHAALLVYVGLIVGALIVGTDSKPGTAPLRMALKARAAYFSLAFRKIVVAQFWIAIFNASCTALFLLILLPAFGVAIPYVGALVAFTFVAGLIPIVGNLLCNGVLTLAGISVSPLVGLACLVFLITIHKAEIFINAKVVGQRTGTATWELLAAMFVGEAVFGLPGLVAAPLFYAYAKLELEAAKLI